MSMRTRGSSGARRFLRSIGDGVALLALAGLTASPADAQFGDFIGYIKKAYDAYKLLEDKPSDVSQLKALILQSKAQIIGELGSITAAWNTSCAINAIDTFQNIELLTKDNLQNFAITSDKCVTDAAAQIDAVSDKAAVNKIGFALNAVAPVALAANRFAGFSTDVLQQHIMAANQKLIAKLSPTCAVSINNPSDLPNFSGSVKGHGACYNFTVPTPARVEVGERGGVFYLTPGPGKAFLPWQLTGKAYPDDEVFYWRGHTAYFPPVDFSIAVAQVMKGTSWEIAKAVLDRLEPSALPLGAPLAVTMSSDTIYRPMDVFLTNGAGTAYQGTLTPSSPPNPVFSGWKATDNPFVSVAAATNYDGRIELFGLSRIGGIYHRWETAPSSSNSWSPTAEMDGQLSSIAIARNKDGTLQLFGTNPFGNIFTRNQVLGGDQEKSVQLYTPLPATDSWTAWKQFDGALTQVAALTGGDGLIHLFGVNSAGQLWHRQQLSKNATDPTVSGAWSPWEQIDVPAPMRTVSVALDLGKRINIICLTGDNRIFQRVRLGSGTVYTPWAQVPGSMRSIVVAKEGGGAGMLVLIGIAPDGKMYRNTSYGLVSLSGNVWTADHWNSWVSLPSPLVIRPFNTDVHVLQPVPIHH